MKGSSSADKMYGGDGNDKMGGWTGDDIFFGGAGNDRLSGGDGAGEIHAQEGDDIDLDGDAAIDKIYGEEGNDFELDGDAGNDLIYGGPGDDGGAPTSENLQHHGLRGEGGENRVYGEDGADTIDAQTTLLSALVYCVHRGRFACVGHISDAELETHLTDLRAQIGNLKLLLESVEDELRPNASTSRLPRLRRHGCYGSGRMWKGSRETAPRLTRSAANS